MHVSILQAFCQTQSCGEAVVKTCHGLQHNRDYHTQSMQEYITMTRGDRTLEDLDQLVKFQYQ